MTPRSDPRRPPTAGPRLRRRRHHRVHPHRHRRSRRPGRTSRQHPPTCAPTHPLKPDRPGPGPTGPPRRPHSTATSTAAGATGCSTQIWIRLTQPGPPPDHPRARSRVGTAASCAGAGPTRTGRLFECRGSLKRRSPSMDEREQNARFRSLLIMCWRRPRRRARLGFLAGGLPRVGLQSLPYGYSPVDVDRHEHRPTARPATWTAPRASAGRVT